MRMVRRPDAMSDIVAEVSDGLDLATHNEQSIGLQTTLAGLLRVAE